MAWRHPKYKHQAFEPVDPDEINENVREFSQEDANLNEHNWAALPEGPCPVKTRIIDRTALTLVQEIRYCPYKLEESSGGQYEIASEFLDDSRRKVRNNPGWTILQNRKFSSGDSLLWIMASFQQVSSSILIGWGSPSYFAIQYALRVNNRIIQESMTDAYSDRDDKYATSANPGNSCFSIDALVPVSSGECTVELVGRCSDPDIYQDTRVATRELICIEIKR